jgi:hypothetical protein
MLLGKNHDKTGMFAAGGETFKNEIVQKSMRESTRQVSRDI